MRGLLRAEGLWGGRCWGGGSRVGGGWGLRGRVGGARRGGAPSCLMSVDCYLEGGGDTVVVVKRDR